MWPAMPWLSKVKAGRRAWTAATKSPPYLPSVKLAPRNAILMSNSEHLYKCSEFDMRIAFLGASLTEGKYGGDFVAAVQARLPAFTLLNHGIAGHTVNRLLERVPRVLEDAPDPALMRHPPAKAHAKESAKVPGPACRPYQRSGCRPAPRESSRCRQ